MNLPTKITVARLALIPLMIASYCLQGMAYWVCCITASLFMLAGFTDFLDGYIARKYNMVTDLGKFLDPIADKILVIAGLFFVVDGGYTNFIVPYVAMICAVIIIAREFVIGLLRQLAALKSFVIAADKSGKVKTAVTLSALTMLLFSPMHYVIGWIGFAELIIATLLTVWSGAHYLYKNRGVFTSVGSADKESKASCADLAAEYEDKEE